MTVSGTAVVGLPSPPPCPTWAGDRVTWGPWKPAPWVSHFDHRCETCRSPDRYVTIGTVYPTRQQIYILNDDTTLAHPTMTLFLTGCPMCGTVDALTVQSLHDEHVAPVELILCDGCDRLCAIGIDTTEARTTLHHLGGHTTDETGDGTDYCPTCTTEET